MGSPAGAARGQWQRQPAVTPALSGGKGRPEWWEAAWPIWGSGGKARLAIGQGMPNSLQGTPQPGGTFLETQTGGLWVFPGELESASVAFE